ncbi:MAG: bidirectional hydrogenase complex protein HoxE [Chloroflexi bacterium]|nr:bidirectional hydrogenase complex protein HoxE [Chloroflexota bacterium]
MAVTRSQRPTPESAPHPSGDNRFRLLEAAMKKHQYRPDALIEVLHRAQELFGYLSTDLLLYIAHSLHLPPSRVYGVATFYHFFSMAPKGQHSCVVCLGTACYVRGSAAILAAAERHLGIKAGTTTPDGHISLETARCLGACGIAPTVVVDGTVTGHQTPEQVLIWIERLAQMVE